jgi:CBS domain-containing protein
MQIETLRSMTAPRLAMVDSDATLRIAALALSKPHIGLVVVCGWSTVTGVVSKSDIVRHLATGGEAEAPITALTSRDVVYCRPADDLYATWQGMAERGLQNMPVIDGDSQPVGVLDIRDALKVLFEEERYQERLLINYVAGIGYQ